MNLIQLFKQFSSNFENKTGNLNKKDPLYQLFDQQVPNLFPTNEFPLSYKVKWSLGQGRWATIPWIAIIDSDITDSVQRGVSIVYLFTNDYKEVYLTLDQGWTLFQNIYRKDAAKNITTVSRFFQENLKILSKKNGFTTDQISLKRKPLQSPQLMRGYERGAFYSKHYTISDLQDSDETSLLEDLTKMILAYTQFKSILIDPRNISTTIEQILKGQQFSDIEKIVQKKNEVPDSPQSLTFVQDNSFEASNRSNGQGKRKRVVKPNYVEKNKFQQQLGDLGEDSVMQFEQKRLKKDPRLSHLVNKIEHSSKVKGDGLGYDITSYDYNESQEKAEKIFIEVKTTTANNVHEPFYMSANELDTLKEQRANYRVYRVFNYNVSAKVKIFHAEDIQQRAHLNPVKFQVKF